MNTKLILAAMLFSLRAGATNWYLDNAATGTSDNSGVSWANAFTNAHTVPWSQNNPGGPNCGDTLFISGGGTRKVYEALTNNMINIPAGCSTNSRFILRVGQDAGHNGVVVLDGGVNDSSLINCSDFITIDGEYQGQRHLILTNIEDVTTASGIVCNGEDLKVFYTELSTLNGIKWINSKYGRFQHNKFSNREQFALSANLTLNPRDKYDSTVFSDNEIVTLWNTDDGPGEAPDGLQVGGGGGILVSNNLFRSATTPQLVCCVPQHPDMLQGVTYDWLIVNNTFLNPLDAAIDGGGNGINKVVIANNTFAVTNLQAEIPSFIRLYGDCAFGSFGILFSLLIANNTFVDQAEAQLGAPAMSFGSSHSGGGCGAGTNSWLPPLTTNCVIANNIVFNCGKDGFAYAIQFYPVTNMMVFGMDFNLLDGGANDAPAIATNYPGAQTWSQPNSRSGTPTWLRYSAAAGNNDFHLQNSDTAAISQGTNLTPIFAWHGVPTSDVAGVARPSSGSTWDLGAYQAIVGSSVSRITVGTIRSGGTRTRQ